MKPPIIIDEHGDVVIYDSIEDAAMGLEAIDVANGEYVGYDSEGRLLRLLPDWPHSAVIKDAEPEPTHQNQLRVTLADFLSQLGLSGEWLERASLDEMVEKARGSKK
jgi:hypothetical protein